ncbi:MAG: amidohydrolase family protein [Clostridia bacterium]|nr:amidohydrolase family protein [Clostridia bacterium]
MIIDFHTHIFPDKIAKKTIELLSEKGGIPPFSDGSVDGLISEMKKAETDISITLPVLTNPAQFDSVNRFAAEINKAFADKERRLISFAGIHPRCEDIEAKMKFIKESGFLGVKLHPDYQGAFITDDGYVKILECAKEYDLIVVTHSGVDGAYRDMPVRCTPKLAKELIRKVPYAKFVLAHYGANEMFTEVLDELCGENVYFDTAYILRFIDEKTFKDILKKHGEDRILFATDSPWSSIRGDVEIIKSFSLDKTTQEKLFYLNAKKLLGI